MTDREDAETLANPDVLGDFQLLDKVGGGGMGTVYRARQLSMDRVVAVKILHEHLAADAAFVDRFDREAHASGKLTHPNIVGGIAAGKAGGRFYFAMEFIDGETVGDVLRKRGHLPVGEAVAIALDVARALEHAHSRLIVHRDIKPSNIMIDRDGVVKVADLGLAKARADESALTQAGGVFGTPAYMAPEQGDAASADPRSDIYALGVTLYHLLTGEKPFAGASITDILDAKRNGAHRPIRSYDPTAPETLERIVDKMIRPDPKQRFQSAGEVIAALEATGLANVQPVSRRRAAGSRRARAIGAIAIAGLMALGALTLHRAWTPPAPARESEQRNLAAGPAAAAAPAGAARDAKQIVLGVMLFKMHGGAAGDEWKREALRDGLNAQLSRLSQVKVYSKEFIDFLITRKELTEIEAAQQLGIKKMLSGSVVVMGHALQIETHVVDVTSGVLDASYTTTGTDEEFLELPNKLANEAIARLDLPVTEEERQALAQQQNATVEALKLLLDAEGGAATRSAPMGPRSDTGISPQSLALMQLGGRWLSVAAAVAQTNPEGDIRELLERYRGATEACQVDALGNLYVSFSREQADAQQRYFQNVRDLRVALDAVDIAIVGDEAVASYTRTDDFVDTRTGRQMHVSVRLTKLLRNQGGAWKLVGGD